MKSLLNKDLILEEINKKYRIVEDTSEFTRAIVNSHSLVFYKIPHTYFVDGKEVPSVSDIIRKMNKNPYKDIKKGILEKGSIRGNNLHSDVILYEEEGKESETSEFESYLALKNDFPFEYVKGELFVILLDNFNHAIACGRLDMVLIEDNKLKIAELKTTSKFYKDNVILQLNLYKLGFEQSYNINIDSLICLRVKDYERELLDIPTNINKTLDTIDLYFKKTKGK